ncbi:MAG: glycerophosphodiester phosphodiesterase family protein [Pseudomonadota bacterium]
MRNKLDNMPKIIAHRGGFANLPDNTLIAFRQAKQYGARMVEFDVQLTLDGVPIVLHDDTLDRTTDGTGIVHDMTLKEVKQVKKQDGNPIPTLEETLQCLTEQQLIANIEIKQCAYNVPHIVEKVMAVALNYKSKLPGMLISSFQYSTLSLIHQHYKDIPIGLLYFEFPEFGLRQAEELNCYSIGIANQYLDQATAELIKAHHYKLLCYVVNDLDRAAQLFSWGVDGIFTGAVGEMKDYL